MNLTAHRAVLTATAAATVLLLSGVVAPAATATPVPSSKNAVALQLEPAHPGTLQGVCADLSSFGYESTRITSATDVATGTLTFGGEPIGEHCLVEGLMNERISSVDGQKYAVGFQMRIPVDWSGRYLYQANGGFDGNVVSATGAIGNGESGLQMGMAVLSSDAGHNGLQNPTFGLDPQARLDYGYQAVGTLTPMAKALVAAAYGRGPDRSYIAGGSNGGRHTMVAAARYANEYDGFLAIAPGFNLPKAALAQIFEVQQWTKIATTPDLNTALTQPERDLIAHAILGQCDGLDRLKDGIVQAVEHCQDVFSLDEDIPTCTEARDGTCLSSEQKTVVANVFAGPHTSEGEPIYSSLLYDPGFAGSDWGRWQFFLSTLRSPMAEGYVFSTPPDQPTLSSLLDYARGLDLDAAAENIYQSDGMYTESAMEFMTPPNPTNLDTMRERGGKMIVVHGTADAAFSADDTASWYRQLDKAYKNHADEFTRFFEVPGMAHVSGGIATDQFAGLAALIAWVEQGQAPDRIAAHVNAGNPELPADWSPQRSRPLCAYPTVAIYKKGDPESADSFACRSDRGHAVSGAKARR